MNELFSDRNNGIYFLLSAKSSNNTKVFGNKNLITKKETNVSTDVFCHQVSQKDNLPSNLSL